MTRRDRLHLLIIHTLLLKIQHIIADTNAHIAQVEAEANRRLEAILQEQVAKDRQVVDTWEQNTRLLWAELEAQKQAKKKAGKPKRTRQIED